MPRNANTESLGIALSSTVTSSQDKECKNVAVGSIQKKSFDFLGMLCESAVAGAAAGAVVETVLYPIDTIKTRLQAVRGGGEIILKGLYSGLAGNLVGVIPASALFIGVYEPTKQKLLDIFPQNLSAVAHLAAGAIGGAASSIVRVPTEVIKQRIQTGQFASAPEAVRLIVAKEGFRGLYAGYGSFLLRDLPFDAVQFCIYEQLRIGYKLAARRDLNDPENAIIGAFAGAITGAITTPLDVVKTRLMIQGSAKQYDGIFHCVNTIIREEGSSAFFRGLGPRVLWIGIGGSIFFGVLEKTKQVLAHRRAREGNGDSLKKNEKLSWSEEAAAKAEVVASIDCSGHGRAYLDGLIVDGNPVCECNTCYAGSHCSIFSSDCAADADSGDPLFLEPFWMQHASSSAVVVAGWHRMSYSFPDQTSISRELDNHIRRVHTIATNAITDGKYIVFGGGSTQLLNAAVYALSMNLSSPASVVAAVPSYPLYETQTDFFQNKNYEFEGDASLMMNSSYANTNVIEFVTSPNNPDGNLREAVCQGPNVKTIYDHAYYWPHFSAIPAPADEDVMIFTISKLTGHAGSRFGWAIVKDKEVYRNMQLYISVAEMGISRETQLRALQLMKTVLHGNGKEIFDYAFNKMSDRWGKLSQIFSSSERFSLQEIPPLFCNFFEKVRGPSPGYAWVKCEKEEDANCNEVLRAANIIGRAGKKFSVSDRYVRLSLLKGDDDFDLLLNHLKKLVDQEDGAKAKAVSSF
ncbi:Pyridoxal phosphate transferases superfamily protein [Perilla frutescens var. hirtella]|uniref:Pyridoxal phosphate transferases superfamily protein n=1 Tax=Perilla frutescens var. hirtella TaxID=608512 RepID=A0AAD4J458_PERFH|nr:Pyridoxal phosphate transferases superfamily protein [Perilla frutescens var. hirtella]